MNNEVKGLFYLGILYAIVYCGEEPALVQLNSVVQTAEQKPHPIIAH